MTTPAAAPAAAHTAGERLFARYAQSPNELGYCGPSGAGALAAVARGAAVAFDVRAAAAQFSGAWAYQVVIGRMLGRDPLDPAVVRGYWTGTEQTAALDRGAFWDQLLAVIGPRAGSYWKHLDAGLAVEAAPSHAFHVLGVYPWTRLLVTGRPEPLDVLNSCCIRPGRVLTAHEDRLTVETETLRYRDGALELVPDSVEVRRAVAEEVRPGSAVALHWGAACDVLTECEAQLLTGQLAVQVERTNVRLSRPLG